MRVLLLVIAIALIPLLSRAQTADDVILSLQAELALLRAQEQALVDSISAQQWSIYQADLLSYGLPSDSFLSHKAYYFDYAEDHEQSRWVAHIIAPEVEQVGEGRSNDFRRDPLVRTATADDHDYFNYYPDRKGDARYEGFGYDRGHLAPSADFRWHAPAVSESFYYSNISPQDPDLNRGTWAQLEAMLRSYVIRHQVPVAVVSAPILADSLPSIPQSVNGISIPEYFYKVVYDPAHRRMIAFLMANKQLVKPVDSYAISVDELEKITGYNYFSNVDQSIESSFDITDWFSEYDEGSVVAVNQAELPPRHYNSDNIARQMGTYNKVSVCGTVVSSRNSKKGHAWLNLDRHYPNDYASIMIYKDDLTNFTYNPVTSLRKQTICAEGEVRNIANRPVMMISQPHSISVDKF